MAALDKIQVDGTNYSIDAKTLEGIGVSGFVKKDELDSLGYITKEELNSSGFIKKVEMPIGFFFQWAPVSGSNIDLSTPDKVKNYYGYGTWKEISGRFLFGRDDSHTINSMGGEESHALTSKENGPHNHTISPIGGSALIIGVTSSSEVADGFASGNMWINTPKGRAGSTTSSGSGKPHNNMPPYLSVYIWQRIA